MNKLFLLLTLISISNINAQEAKEHLLYSKVIGFSISPFGIINGKSTAFGIGINAIVGKVRF